MADTINTVPDTEQLIVMGNVTTWTSMVGLKTATCVKISPKMVNLRDIAGNAEKEEETRQINLIRQWPQHLPFCHSLFNNQGSGPHNTLLTERIHFHSWLQNAGTNFGHSSYPQMVSPQCPDGWAIINRSWLLRQKKRLYVALVCYRSLKWICFLRSLLCGFCCCCCFHLVINNDRIWLSLCQLV